MQDHNRFWLGPSRFDVSGGHNIRIATYNLKNLFLCGEGPIKPEAEVRPLARMLMQVAADLWVLQEVGSLASLQRLNARLARPYPYCAVLPGNSDRSIHLGVLARGAVSVTSHRHAPLRNTQGQLLLDHATASLSAEWMPLSWSRDLLRIDARIASRWLAVFGVHLKSRKQRVAQEHAADEVRAAECRLLVQHIDAFQRKYPDRLVILAGDFNDVLASPALAALQALQLYDPLGACLARRGGNPSTYWPKRRARIDHLLVCQRTRALVVDSSPHIHAHRMAQTASDHYPVSLDLALETDGWADHSGSSSEAGE